MKLNFAASIRPRQLLAKILVPVALGGAVWGLSQYPAQAQTNGLTPPPAISKDVAPDPQDGPDGPPAPPTRDGQRGPRGRAGDDRRPGPRGPRDEMRPGPREGGPDADDDGPRPGPRGERPEGPDGPPPPHPGDEAGPRGRGPRDGGPDRDRNRPHPDEFGPGDERGPRDDGPDGRGPRDERGPRDGGPGPRDERGPRDRGPRDAMDDAKHIVGDVDAFGKISGDAYNVSGQARNYYQRALEAQKAGDKQKANELACVSVNLGHAAVLLAEEQTGHKLPEVRGDAGPGPDAPRPPAPDDAHVKRDAGRMLNRAYNDLGDNKGQWNETARRLYTAARKDYDAGKFDSAQGRARAASHLVEAGRLLA